MLWFSVNCFICYNLSFNCVLIVEAADEHEGRAGHPAGDGARWCRRVRGRRTRAAIPEAGGRASHGRGVGPGLAAARREGDAPRERRRARVRFCLRIRIRIGTSGRRRARARREGRARRRCLDARRGARAPPRGRPGAARAALPALPDAHRAATRLATPALGGRAQPTGLPRRLQVRAL